MNNNININNDSYLPSDQNASQTQVYQQTNIQQSQQPIQQPQQPVQQPIQQPQQPMQPQMNTGYTKKNNKKIIILLILFVFVVIGVVAFILFKPGKNESVAKDSNYNLSSDAPIAVKNNGKYGYVTSDGKVMIEPKYNEASDFCGDYAIVNVDNPDAGYYNKTLYQIIDKKGEVKKSLNNKPYCNPVYNIWEADGILYDSNLNEMFPDKTISHYIGYGYSSYYYLGKNEAGIITHNGDKIFTTKASSNPYTIIPLNSYDENDLYAYVEIYNNKEKTKRIILSLKTGEILFTLPENHSAFGGGDGIFYYYDRTIDDGLSKKKYLFFINDKLAYETPDIASKVYISDYDNQILKIDYGYNYQQLGKSQQIYYYDVKNGKMFEENPIPQKSEDETSAIRLERSYGFREYSCSDKYGLKKYGLKSGKKVILPCKYSRIEYLDKNLFKYMKSMGQELVLLDDGKNFILYNLQNSKAVMTFDSSSVYSYSNTTFLKVTGMYAKDGTSKFKVYNLLSGKSKEFSVDEKVEMGSNYITVKKDGKIIYYNTNLKQVYAAAES